MGVKRPLLSWWKRGDRYSVYACSSNTPEAIKRMREDGFIPMAERVAQLINEHKETN